MRYLNNILLLITLSFSCIPKVTSVENTLEIAQNNFQNFNLHYLPYKKDFLDFSLLDKKQEVELDFLGRAAAESLLTSDVSKKLNKLAKQCLISLKKDNLEIRTVIERENFGIGNNYFHNVKIELVKKSTDEKDNSLIMFIEFIVVTLITITYIYLGRIYEKKRFLESNPSDPDFLLGFEHFLIGIFLWLIYFLIWNYRVLIKLITIDNKKIRTSYFLLVFLVNIPVIIGMYKFFK